MPHPAAAGEPSSFDSPAGLLGTWSYLNEPEPCSLPSTVDMTAFKAGPSDPPKPPSMQPSPSGSSESEASNSSSSDSDSSSSSGEGNGRTRTGSTPGPRFSVTSSDNAGLRMKIAAIPNRPVANKPAKDNVEKTKGTNSKSKTGKETANKTNCKNDSSTDSSCDRSSCSNCSGSESGPSERVLPRASATTRSKSSRTRRLKKKKANRGGSTSSGGRTDSSESDSSEDSLQEINAEDLAAILPPEDFGGFEAVSNSNKPRVEPEDAVVADGASSSDMELPAQLVNAAIQRAESGSDNESRPPPSTYASSLLQDFVAKTQILSHSPHSPVKTNAAPVSAESHNKSEITSDKHNAGEEEESHKDKNLKPETSKSDSVAENSVPETKRKRGRPRKQSQAAPKEAAPALVVAPNESPDSGILSNHHSPIHSPARAETRRRLERGTSAKPEPVKPEPIKPEPKIKLISIERTMYPTERVLYPPRGRASRTNKRGPGRPPKSRTVVKSLSPEPKTKPEDLLDPVWRQIDLNLKYRKPKDCGYKSDYGAPTCSRMLAAQSGYLSDYGSGRVRSRSGYRSDHSTKGAKSTGYRSDYSTRAKSCGYRSDCSVRKHKRFRKKRRIVKTKTQCIETELDILKLAGLSLGQSNDDSNSGESNATKDKIKTDVHSNLPSRLPVVNETSSLSKCNAWLSKDNRGSSVLATKCDENVQGKKTTNSFLNEICERVTRSLAGSDTPRTVFRNLSPKSNVADVKPKTTSRSRKSSIVVDVKEASIKTNPVLNGLIRNKTKNITRGSKGKMITSLSLNRRLSAKVKKHKKTASPKHRMKKFKKRKRLKSFSKFDTSSKSDSKVSPEIDNLIDSFIKLCQITPEKLVIKEKPQSDVVKCLKRVAKKRKGSENGEAPATTPAVGSKRRHKKLPPTQSPDDHKLPLKKRHYLITTSNEHRPARTTTRVQSSSGRPDQKESKIDRDSKPVVVSQTTVQSATGPTAEAVELFKAHMDEAIEACISKYSGSMPTPPPTVAAQPNKVVTPKKRHLLEPKHDYNMTNQKTESQDKTDTHDPITHLENRGGLSISASIQLKCQQVQQKKSEIVTRKKNRLEGLVSKIQPSVSSQGSDTAPTTNQRSSLNGNNNRPTVIRTPTTNEISTKSQPPPGVFEPSVDIELHIPVSKINVASALIMKNDELVGPVVAKSIVASLKTEPANKVTNIIAKKAGVGISKGSDKNVLKKRRRKAINRTGFPTLKRKKKKAIAEVSERTEQSEVVTKLSKLEKKPVVVIENNSEIKTAEKCDRVPLTGEAASTFIERSIRPRLSVVSLERLQGKSKDMFHTDCKKPKEAIQTDVKKVEIKTPVVQLERPKRKISDPSLKSNMEDSTLKRVMRDIAVTKKRTRERSQIEIIINKKVKNDQNRVKKPLLRDNSSDNEPLISLVPKPYENKTTTDSKIEKHVKTTKVIPKPIECKNNDSRSIKSTVKENSILKTATKLVLNSSELKNADGTDKPTLDTKTLKTKNVVPKPIDCINTDNGNNKSASKDCKSTKTQRLVSKQNEPKTYVDGNKNLKSTTLVEIDPKKANMASQAVEIDPKKANMASQAVETDPKAKKSSDFSTDRLSSRAAPKKNIKMEGTPKPTIVSERIRLKSLKSEINQSSIEKQNEIEKPALKLSKTALDKQVNRTIPSDVKKTKCLKPNKTTVPNSEASKDFIDMKKGAIPKNVTALRHKSKVNIITDVGPPLKEKLSSGTYVKAASKISEISISIPERPKSRLSQMSLPTPPLSSGDAIEQEPLPLNEGPNVIVQRDDSPASSDKTASSGSGERNGKKKPPKWKKKYLVAGLLSDYYKEDVPKISEPRPNRSLYRPEDHPYGLLPPPPYCEKFYRQTVRDFQLPYDLWWLHQHSRLPGRDIVPSWNYRKIRTNVYYDTRPNLTCESQACSCKPDAGCSEDCINRLVYTECSPQHCPCTDKCQNQRIQKHEIAQALDRFMTENKGWGVRTKKPIPSGSFILEYVGEVVTEREFKHRMGNRYLRDTHHYCLHLDGGLVIDGHRMGGNGRFVNHSCAPNCEMQKWSVNGLSRMALFALRDIGENEELTYDYNFALFNPSEGQPCKCGAPQCRGVIGGKTQRIVRPIEGSKAASEPEKHQPPVRVGRPRKRKARRSLRAPHKEGIQPQPAMAEPNVREKGIIQGSHCFLLRNLDKVRRIRDRCTGLPTAPTPPPIVPSISAQMNALRGPRYIKTRGLALVEQDPELGRTARLATLLKEICIALGGLKDESGVPFISRLALPPKRKVPLYYERIQRPIDMSSIECNIEAGVYKVPQAFDNDILRLLGNAVKFYGINSPEGTASQTLTELYNTTKTSMSARLLELLGSDTSAQALVDGFLPKKEIVSSTGKYAVEDKIRCICGLFKDEGMMIQCSVCLCWQHVECTKADPSVEKYLCEQCDMRTVDLEIPLDEYTEDGHRYYLSLLRGELQIRQGDTVYVLRDIPITPPEGSDSKAPVAKHTYETIGLIDYSELDIFRVERLWKNKEGKRLVYGHHYLRPHETYHEPTRKFYQNEVVRVPLYEVVPIELVMARCWVLDPNTYCRGRPADSVEPHVYICELRVDKSARLFSKISRHAYSICMKNYAFHKFEQRLKISRTYAPHDLGTVSVKARGRRGPNEDHPRKVQPALAAPPIKTKMDRRTHLNSVLTRLTKRLPVSVQSQPAVDLSYLLTGRGARNRRLPAPTMS